MGHRTSKRCSTGRPCSYRSSRSGSSTEFPEKTPSGPAIRAKWRFITQNVSQTCV